jgi:hypothetical protein
MRSQGSHLLRSRAKFDRRHTSCRSIRKAFFAWRNYVLRHRFSHSPRAGRWTKRFILLEQPHYIVSSAVAGVAVELHRPIAESHAARRHRKYSLHRDYDSANHHILPQLAANDTRAGQSGKQLQRFRRTKAVLGQPRNTSTLRRAPEDGRITRKSDARCTCEFRVNAKTRPP